MSRKRNPIHFVVGCPRSGTYLLSSILNSSGRIAIPTETHFIPLFQPCLWLAGDLSRVPARRRLVRAIFVFLRVWLARAEQERDFAAVSRHSLLEVEHEADQIARDAQGYDDLVLRLFAAYARLKGATLAGDKSAFFDHVPLDRLDAASEGDAKFIHVLRDGRDVCVSWRKIRVGPRSVGEAARTWSRHVSGKRSWGAAHADRYHEVRYEDLLRDPKAALRAVCGFIGVPYSDSLLRFHESPYSRDIAAGTTHPRLGQPLDPANHGKWRHEMSPEEVGCFEGIAGTELLSCGYPVGGPHGGVAPSGRRRAPRIAVHRLRLALKRALPACALLADRLHVPLERVCNNTLWLRAESLLSSPGYRSPGG